MAKGKVIKLNRELRRESEAMFRLSLQEDIRGGEISDTSARLAIKIGITPRALEAAAASRNLRALAQRHAVDLSSLRALRMRWGNRP